MAYLDDTVLDDGLDAGIAAKATATNLDVHICSEEPVDYTGASTTYTLGNKADVTVTGPAAGDASGRKVTIDAITGGSVTGSDTATHWALVDTDATLLVAAQSLSAPQAVTSGNTFSLAAFDIELIDPA